MSTAPIPSPSLVAAWARLGRIHPDELPLWAAHWMLDHAGSGLVALAALSSDEHDRIRDALPGALADCGVDGDLSLSAAIRLVFLDIADSFLAGAIDWRSVIREVEQVLTPEAFDAYPAEPLSSLYGHRSDADFYDASAADNLEPKVRKACLQQRTAS